MVSNMLGATTSKRRPLRIAMIGQKGLPATYGGIEHVVSETGSRLADRGHEVTVYTRRSYGAPPASPYLGMNVVPAPTIACKHLDAIVHSAASTVKALAHRHDVVHYHAIGPGLMAPLPRYLSPSKVVLTVHGLDHERSKWGSGARSVLQLAHWVSGRVPDQTLVVSHTLREHYLRRFDHDVTYIPNGVAAPAVSPASTASAASAVESLGLQPGRYLLFVGRIVPEKAPDRLLEAYGRLPGDVQLAIVGDSSWSDDYTRRVHELAAADPRVVLTGYRYGAELAALYEHAAVFVQPSSVEGLPLTLLEAISHGQPVVVSDIGPHLEVIGPVRDAARTSFRTGDTGDLARALGEVLGALDAARAAAPALRSAVLTRYDWDLATDLLEEVYLSLAGDRMPHRVQTARRTHAAAPLRQLQ